MNYYLNGKLVEIVEADIKMEPFKRPVLVKEVKVFNGQCYGYEYVVEQDSLEPVATEAFSLGNHVMLKNGTYFGIVKGFEPEINAVITQPDTLITEYNKHIRYAHSASALERVSKDKVYLAAGMTYRVNKGQVLMAFKYVDTNKECVSLVNNRGIVIHKDIPEVVDIATLSLVYGITEITKTNREEWTV